MEDENNCENKCLTHRKMICNGFKITWTKIKMINFKQSKMVHYIKARFSCDSFYNEISINKLTLVKFPEHVCVLKINMLWTYHMNFSIPYEF